MNTKQPPFHPLRFISQYQYRLWGGEKLATVLKRAYEGEKRGESWEISAVAGYASEVADGAFKGSTLPELIEKYPEEIMGKSVVQRFGTTFPLLIKFIDAKIPLSVQVHPNDALAKERHNSFGKNEMWYILDAAPDAELMVGFNQEVDGKAFDEAVATNRLEAIVHREKVSAGDAIYIPTGTLHAIGGGILLAEIQQTSDITYRVYDYNRTDAHTGKKRELHTELAKEAIDFSAQQPSKTAYAKKQNEVNKLIHTPYFNTSFIPVEGTFFRNLSSRDTFHIYICVGGEVSLLYEEKEYPLAKGSTILIPATIRSVAIKGIGEVLEVFL